MAKVVVKLIKYDYNYTPRYLEIFKQKKIDSFIEAEDFDIKEYIILPFKDLLTHDEIKQNNMHNVIKEIRTNLNKSIGVPNRILLIKYLIFNEFRKGYVNNETTAIKHCPSLCGSAINIREEGKIIPIY